jgi:metal-responsive CopG/Arc/MetJ family transcriptional regulator
MPKQASGNFDQSKYQNDWNKKNMKRVSADYKSDFVDEFKASCKVLDLSQSEVIRDAMQQTIERAKAVSK